MAGTTNATVPKKIDLTYTPKVDVNLYIGIFFDGTNNNKVQSMLALSDRRKRFYKKYNKELKNLNINSYEEMLELTKARDFFSNNKIGTISELDSILGSSMSFDLFMERKIATDNDSIYRQATSADDLNEKSRNSLRDIACLEYDGDKSNELFMGGGNTAGASNYTNIAILSSLYKTSEESNCVANKNQINRYYSIYIEGAGTTDELNLVKNIARIHKSVLGLGFGIGEDGITNKCRQATKRILNIVESISSKEDIGRIYCYFDVFGFSRGAATARAFAHILNPNDDKSRENKYLNSLLTGSEEQFLKKNTNKIVHKEIQTLGLFDTVASIGVLREECNYLIGNRLLNIGKNPEFNKEKICSFFHDTNVTDFGLYSTDQASKVLHICALDEFRKNFALVNIESNIDSRNGLELFIPGCHTDIGGGSKLGLDNPKVINFDEIATRGEILFLLYVRVQGIITFYESTLTIVGKLSHPELLFLPGSIEEFVNLKNLMISPSNPYVNLKILINDFNTAVSGLFSCITGYENIAEYDADNNGNPQKDEKTTNNHSDLYKWITTSYKSIDALISNVENSPNLLKKDINTFRSFIEERNIYDKIQNIDDLWKAGADLYKLFEKTYDDLKDIYSGFEKLKKDPAKNIKFNLREEFEAFIKNESAEWKQLISSSNTSLRMIKLLFKGNRKDFITPLEHRRICMYTGDKPYGNIDKDRENIKPVCIQTLQDAGWLPETLKSTTRKTFFSGRATKKDLSEASKNGKSVIVDGTRVAFVPRKNVLIYKYCKPGYSNLPLKAMYEWANKKRPDMFTNYPNNAYPIPQDLQEFYIQMSNKIGLLGREYCVPEMSKYKEIRCNYLHLSMNQQANNVGDNGLINGPSFKTVSSNLPEEKINKLKDTVIFEGKDSYQLDSLIARRIYVGKMPSETAGGKEFYAYEPSKTRWLFD